MDSVEYPGLWRGREPARYPRREDFTTFVEIDPHHNIAVSSRMIVWEHLDRDQEARLYKNYGSVGDFVHRFAFSFDRIEAGDASNRLIIMLWELNKEPERGGDDRLWFYANQRGANDDEFNIVFAQRSGGSNYFVKYITGPFYTNEIYYAEVERQGTQCRLRIYSDPDYSTLLGETSASCLTEEYKYLVVGAVGDFAADRSDWSSGWLRDLWLMR